MHGGIETVVAGTLLAGLFAGTAVVTDQTVAFVRDINRKQQAHEIQVALELYYMDAGTYPGNLAELTPDYIRAVPLDPKDTKPYAYEQKERGNSYALYLEMERPQTSELSPELSQVAAGMYAGVAAAGCWGAPERSCLVLRP